jgi:ABC-type branched-subunit amino acid transport system ATPase component/ABC-type branched-subunit amino acid transport system permease subunit
MFSLTRVLVFALVALSVTVLTGWAGQLSLGQFAFVGLGAMVVSAVSDRGVRFEVALAYAAAAGVLAAVVVGLPALRAGGLPLTVATLAFAVGSWSWLLRAELFAGEDRLAFVPRSHFLGISLESQEAYYYLCLVILVGAGALVARIGRNGPGRSIVATRDNDQRAASFGIPSAATKLLSFAISGGLAALAGGLLAGARVTFTVDDFAPEESLAMVAIVVIGGLGTITGALVGTLYVIGLPALFGSAPEVQLLTTGLGLLVLVMYFPGGLARPLFLLRDLLVRRWTSGVETGSGPSAAARALRPTARSVDHGLPPTRPLAVEAVSVEFGGLRAIDAVSLQVEQGEVVGLIGSNGAGKSTLMAVVSGFVTPTQGSVHMFGADVTDLAPHRRATAGLGRVFQDARLFPSLTVHQTILTALEARERSELVPTALWLPPARRAEASKRSEAEDVIGLVGLGRYRDALIGELSTGTRRIVELACLIAQRSRLLLLDEPTAGVAQREAEAFGPLVVDIAKELDASILLIEHDLPMVLGISDRVYCMSAGQVIAEGPPAEVAADPGVVAAYLGTDDRAIRRSGAGSTTKVVPT